MLQAFSLVHRSLHAGRVSLTFRHERTALHWCISGRSLGRAALVSPLFGVGTHPVQFRKFAGFFDLCQQALSAAGAVIGPKVADYGLDKLIDHAEVFLWGPKPEPATKEQVSKALAVLSKIDAQNDDMQALQIMQVAAPIMKSICSTLVDMARSRPDLHVHQIVMCNDEVSSAIPKLLRAVENSPTNSCRSEIESMAKLYIKAVKAALDFVAEYNKMGRLARWWGECATQQKITTMKDTYSAFLQAFQFVLQVDTRIAIDHGFTNMRSRFDKLDLSMQAFSSAGDALKSSMDGMSTQMGGISSRADHIYGTQQNIQQQMTHDTEFLKEGLNFLVREHVQMRQTLSQQHNTLNTALNCIVDVVKEQSQNIECQNQIIKEQSKNVSQVLNQNGVILGTLDKMVEQNRQLLDILSQRQSSTP